MSLWINLYQAWAWIAFRDREIAAAITTAGDKQQRTLYHADGSFRAWPEGAFEGGADKLLQVALADGKLVAWKSEGTDRRAVDGIYWHSHRHWDEETAWLVEQIAVERIWPAQPQQRSAIYDQGKVRSLYDGIADAHSLGIGEAARQVQALYEHQISKPAPSISHLKRWVREWRKT